MTKKITSFNSTAAVAVAMLISACSVANLGWLWNSEEVDRSFAIAYIGE